MRNGTDRTYRSVDRKNVHFKAPRRQLALQHWRALPPVPSISRATIKRTQPRNWGAFVQGPPGSLKKQNEAPCGRAVFERN